MKPIAKFEYEPGIHVTVYDELDPDWSWAEDEPTKAKVSRGDIVQVSIIVSVFDKTGNVEGFDSLGEIVIGYDHHKQEIRDAIEANEMVAEAKRDLEEKLTAIIAGRTK